MFDTMEDAMKDCCDDVWAIIQVQGQAQDMKGLDSFNFQDLKSRWEGGREMGGNVAYNATLDGLCLMQMRQGSDPSILPSLPLSLPPSYLPSLTLRFPAESVPDSRTLQWSPLKSPIPRQQSGQVCHYTL